MTACTQGLSHDLPLSGNPPAIIVFLGQADATSTYMRITFPLKIHVYAPGFLATFLSMCFAPVPYTFSACLQWIINTGVSPHSGSSMGDSKYVQGYLLQQKGFQFLIILGTW